MSLWYDSKKNEYASDGRNGWLKAFCEKAIGDLKKLCSARYDEICERLEKHFSGTADRHKAGDVDYSDSMTVHDYLEYLNGCATDLGNDLDDEVKIRKSEDAALQANINNEATARANADTALRNNIGSLTDLSTSDKTSIVNAINEVGGDVDYINAALRSGGIIRVSFVDLRDEGCNIQDSFSLNDCVPEEYGSYKMFFVLYETTSGEGELHSVLLYSTYGRIDGNTAYTQYYTDVNGVSYYRCTKDGDLDDWTDWRESISALNIKTSSGTTVEAMIDTVRTDVGSLADLSTTNKTSIVSAINEVDSNISGLNIDIGDLSDTVQNLTNNLQTIDKNLTVDILEEESAREQAVKELQDKITALEARIAAVEAPDGSSIMYGSAV